MTTRILITGADGFVGKHLQGRLAKAFPDAELIPLSGPNSKDPASLDITNPDSVSRAIEAALPDHVIHLAAMAAVSTSLAQPNLAIEVNLTGTLNVIRAMEAHVPDARLLFASSSEIYGRSFKSGIALDESAPLAPANPYAVSKAAADLAVQEAAHRSIKATIFRLFNHTGPGQSESFVLPSFAAQIARIETGQQTPIMRVGNLAAARDFLDIEDVLNAYISAIARSDACEPCAVFNIASGSSYSIQSLLDAMLEASSMDIAIERDAARFRPVDIARTLGNPAHAISTLGWAVKHDIKDTVKSLLAHQRAISQSVQD